MHDSAELLKCPRGNPTIQLSADGLIQKHATSSTRAGGGAPDEVSWCPCSGKPHAGAMPMRQP